MKWTYIILFKPHSQRTVSPQRLETQELWETCEKLQETVGVCSFEAYFLTPGAEPEPVLYGYLDSEGWWTGTSEPPLVFKRFI